MIIRSTPEVSTNDGTPFPTKFTKKDLTYSKVLGNNTLALYAAYDKSKEKLKGYYMQSSTKLWKVDIGKIRLITLLPEGDGKK